MSTKIFNAYKYNGTLSQLMKDLFAIREKYLGDFEPQIISTFKHIRNEMYKDLEKQDSSLSIQELREGKLPSDPDQHKKLREASDAASKFVVDSLTNGTWDQDITASITVYIYKNQTYLQFFGFKCIENYLPITKNRLEDWHYQNQTDKPKGVKNWAQRRNMWDRVFRDYETPRMAGLDFPVMDQEIIKNLLWFEVFKF
jgi:hypothetical protein